MTRKRITASQRAMIEIELRRQGGRRALAALAIFGLVGAMALGSATIPSDETGLQTESYEVEAPSSLDEKFREESLAAAPATSRYDVPELAASHGHG